MKARISFLVLFVSILVFISCQSGGGSKEETNADSTAKITQLPDTIQVADLDTLKNYPEYCNDPKVAEMIAAKLKLLLKDDLGTLPVEQRVFKYHAFDLNNDNTKEFFVAPAPGPYFCGTGGCTAWLLTNTGDLITTFTVTDFPIYIAASKSDGWQDLIIESKGVKHYVKPRKGVYPGNPSVQPKFKGDPPNLSPQVLDIYEGKYPSFTY